MRLSPLAAPCWFVDVSNSNGKIGAGVVERLMHTSGSPLTALAICAAPARPVNIRVFPSLQIRRLALPSPDFRSNQVNTNGGIVSGFQVDDPLDSLEMYIIIGLTGGCR
jgi:hypothetical protein